MKYQFMFIQMHGGTFDIKKIFERTSKQGFHKAMDFKIQFIALFETIHKLSQAQI